MRGVSSETEALVCFSFPEEAKRRLFILFLEEANPQHICKLGCIFGYKKTRCWGVSVSREGKIFSGVVNFMFAWHPPRALAGVSSTSKCCTSSSKTFSAVQMKKVSLGDIEPTTVPLP